MAAERNRYCVETQDDESHGWVELPGCNNLGFSMARWRLAVHLAQAAKDADRETARTLNGASRRVAKWRDLSQLSAPG